ncbi:hypothetical protein G5V57_18290 [Nordella sp. HKS 07]|uniref:hypothetical protein n=1 Tax=Nordella sp. HKS 07 TaxID=2712222 RepID=UPI0013E19919|nr:hypothetical protein [Nordella sp. HKS 07]QIG49487.1 hypothetical protein G5V57_18290 [Nordella sp. HKS 07]
MSGYRIIMSIGVVLVLAGCTYTPKEVADPRAITLKSAMIQTADSLDELHRRTEGRQRFGQIVDEVTVVFNISAHATNTGKLTLNPASIPLTGGLLGGGTLGATAENTLVADSNRGNQITIKLKNFATADTSKLSKLALEACNRKPRPDWCTIILSTPPAK